MTNRHSARHPILRHGRPAPPWNRRRSRVAPLALPAAPNPPAVAPAARPSRHVPPGTRGGRQLAPLAPLPNDGDSGQCGVGGSPRGESSDGKHLAPETLARLLVPERRWIGQVPVLDRDGAPERMGVAEAPIRRVVAVRRGKCLPGTPAKGVYHGNRDQIGS